MHTINSLELVTLIITASLFWIALGALVWAAIVSKNNKHMFRIIQKIMDSNSVSQRVFIESLGLSQARIDELTKNRDDLEQKLTEVTDELASIMQADDEDVEDDDEDENSAVVVKKSKRSTADDKLETVKALLEEAVKTEAPVNVNSLLGILNCKLAE